MVVFQHIGSFQGMNAFLGLIGWLTKDNLPQHLIDTLKNLLMNPCWANSSTKLDKVDFFNPVEIAICAHDRIV